MQNINIEVAFSERAVNFRVWVTCLSCVIFTSLVVLETFKWVNTHSLLWQLIYKHRLSVVYRFQIKCHCLYCEYKLYDLSLTGARALTLPLRSRMKIADAAILIKAVVWPEVTGSFVNFGKVWSSEMRDIPHPLRASSGFGLEASNRLCSSSLLLCCKLRETRRDASKLERCHYNLPSDLRCFVASLCCNVEAVWRNFKYFQLTILYKK